MPTVIGVRGLRHVREGLGFSRRNPTKYAEKRHGNGAGTKKFEHEPALTRSRSNRRCPELGAAPIVWGGAEWFLVTCGKIGV